MPLSGPIRLVLPLPPSQNVAPGRHAMAKHRMKRAYQKAAWAAAVTQAKPMHDPPARVRIQATFYLRNLRDEDNLEQSLKFPLDALKQRQQGRLDWRQGLYEPCGYLVDDAPEHCRVEKSLQAIDRKHERLELTLVPIPPPSAAACAPPGSASAGRKPASRERPEC